MSVPAFQDLMLPVLKATAGSEIGSAELRSHVASELGLNESDLAEMLPSGRQTYFANRIAWANVFLQRAGLISKKGRGIYQATDEGRRVLASAPVRIDNRYLARYPSFVEWRQTSAATDISGDLRLGQSDSSKTPEEQLAANHAALMATLESDLLDRVREATPGFFEALIVDLLIAMGYGGGRGEMGQAVGRANDGGIDGIIKEDALGLDIVYIQGKRYGASNTVGRPEVQSFAGSLDGVGATKGIFVTTSRFSPGAIDFVNRISKRIVLIDGEELSRLMVQHNVGVRVRSTFEIKKIDEDYFTE